MTITKTRKTYDMSVVFGLIFCFSLTGCKLAPTPAMIALPKNEIKIINEVADEYALKGEARLLLFVIRKIENGRPGREFGVLHPDAINSTYRNQAQWAAGTIKKRYNGDLYTFAERWAPAEAHSLNVNWIKNACFYMNKWSGYAG